MSARRVFAGSHGASHLRAELGAARTQFAALCAAFGADAILSAKIWLVFAASGAGVVLAGCPPPGQPRNTNNFCDAGVLFSHLRREVAEVTILYKQPEHTGAIP